MDKKLDLLYQRMDECTKQEPGAMPIEGIKARFNKWDGEHVQHQRESEKDCRKRRDGKFPYFLEMNVGWHKRRVYR